MNYRMLCVAGWLSLLLVAPASAKILYEDDTDVMLKAGHSGLIPTTQFSPWLQYEAYPSNTILARVFANVIVRMSDVGTTFVATPQNDAGFINFAKLMTDGRPQWLTITTGAPGGAGGSNECSQLYRDFSCASGVDFQGHVIERITFTQKTWYMVSPGSDPNGDGLWTDHYGAHRLTIEGYAIPEPGVLTLSMIGIISMLSIGVRRRP